MGLARGWVIATCVAVTSVAALVVRQLVLTRTPRVPRVSMRWNPAPGQPRPTTAAATRPAYGPEHAERVALRTVHALAIPIQGFESPRVRLLPAGVYEVKFPRRNPPGVYGPDHDVMVYVDADTGVVLNKFVF